MSIFIFHARRNHATYSIAIRAETEEEASETFSLEHAERFESAKLVYSNLAEITIGSI